jgi:translocation and assembly module TamB
MTAPPTFARRWRLAAALVAVVAVVAGGTAAAVAWLVGTSNGLGAIVRLVNALTPVRLAAEKPQGSLRGGFAFARLRVTVATTEVDLHDVAARIAAFGARPWRIDFEALSASRVAVRVRPPPVPRPEPLRSIASPIAASVARLQIGEFALRVGADDAAPAIAAREIDGAIALDADGYRIERGAFVFGRSDAPLAATLRGSVGGSRPFALSARGTLVSRWQDKPVQASLAAEGSLERFEVTASVAGGGAGGMLAATVASFASPALQSLRVDISGIDPRLWAADAPQADLRLQADLQPIEGNPFGLAGSATVLNSAPGPIDANRIPARSAAGRVHWRGNELRVDEAEVHLVRGTARGDFALQFGTAPAWQTEARFGAVDPAAIHSKLRPLRVGGHVSARRAADTSHVVAELRHRGDSAASLAVDLRATRHSVQLNRALLTVGGGRLEAGGEIGLTGVRRVHLQGTAVALDAGQLVEGFAARISGEFALEGQLQPQPSGRLDLRLTDSVAFGRPLAGRAAASLSPAQELAVDLDLAVRSARLRAAGGLGAPGRSLQVELEAPALAELALPLHGAATARATLRGDWRAPAVDARVHATKLRLGSHAIEDVRLLLDYGGGSDGALTLRAELAGHRFAGHAPLSVRTATLAVDGRVREHAIALDAVYDDTRTARFAAHGGWSEGRWRGRLTEASTAAPFALKLLEPSAVETDGKTLRLGPARLEAFGAVLADLRFDADGGQIATRGRFDEFRPGDLVARRIVNVLPRGPRVPLTLRGAWRLRLGATADGELEVERAGGDLYAGGGADAAMGLAELRLRATLRANALAAEAHMHGTRLGRLRATLAARVERDAEAGWRLAQSQPWSVEADADSPSIAWLNSLATDRVRANVRVGGAAALRLKIEGTPASPIAHGAISGSDLRLAWIEQGVRLENGQLSARIEGDSIVLDELRFSGPPRVRPSDHRVAQIMARMEPGFVAASGRLKIPELTGVVQVQAQRVPLLQRPDRWVVATGGANIEFSPRRVQFNGAVAADAGFVDLSRPDLPGLSSDVIVIESADAPREREPRVAFGFDLGLDAGAAFYVRGAGLDTRVGGAVRLRSEGKGIVRATGALTAEDGTYEGYGQKLRIARGRVNFQGPPENPGLDILALRTGLPPEAGEIGISITRTAANPLIRLYSDPPLPDYQALSWLVLGRPAEQGADNVALARAAIGLLAGGGEGLPTTLARQLGIDEISLRVGAVGGGASLLPRSGVAGSLRGDAVGGGTAYGEIITIGKRLNEALTVSYEQALTGAAGVVLVSYQLTRRLSLIGRAGTENALDLVYSIAFD